MAHLTSFIITTGYDPAPPVRERAKSLSCDVGVPFIERERNSLNSLCINNQVDYVLVFTSEGPILQTPAGKYFFHLSMAELRIKHLQNGKHDHMIAAMNLQQGMSVLDCTLGLATDAIVASFVAGSTGNVTGLESSFIASLIARLGLTEFQHPCANITEAMRRIKVVETDSHTYLETQLDASYDVVYFDPMFRQPVYSSSNINPIRGFADKRSLTLETISQATRVARQRVVFKEKRGSSEFERLGFTILTGGKHSNVQYGIMEV